jgi:multidrug resistance efflux pump
VNPQPLADRKSTPRIYLSPRIRKSALVLAAAVVVLVGGFFLWRYLSSYESTDDAQADVHLYPVSARISGYVVRVDVDDNQWVQKGIVLVEIDPKDYEVAVAQAQANLASAEATAQSLNITVPITSVSTSSQLKFTASDIENTKAGVIAAERQLTAAHAQLEQAEANDVKAQDDLHRYKMLVDKREVAEQIYDQALAAAKSSTAAVAAAHANESAAQQFVQQARSRLAEAMEAQLCEREHVVVVGGGNSAGPAAVFLSQTARKVYMLVRSGQLSDTMSRYLIQRIQEKQACWDRPFARSDTKALQPASARVSGKVSRRACRISARWSGKTFA